jgi:hypothetical protein
MRYVTDTDRVNLVEALRILGVVSPNDRVDTVAKVEGHHLHTYDAIIAERDSLSAIKTQAITTLGGKNILNVYGLDCCGNYCDAEELVRVITKVERTDIIKAVGVYARPENKK